MDADTGSIGSTSDPLTAAPDSVPRRRPEVLTLGDCWRHFVRQPSPPLLAAALTAAVILRLLLGHYSWRDAVVAASLVAVTPVVEWMIHVYLLHARPFRLGGREFDLLAAREHRSHHRAPSVLVGVLIPRYAVVVFAVQIALTLWVISFPAHLILGGDRLGFAATGVIVAYAILATYEWCHFLIHTPYRARGRYYRSIWRSHRLHHFKNENYWFGVTSTVGDRLLRTAPDQSAVEKSGTARSLGADPLQTQP
jgi:sterol desaturase/sphingolipid hydroxylase (fatty acid hydroxylase superfamily)